MKNATSLLTIAIPTFNRGGILRNALQHLGPQLEEFANVVELVLSDNGSEDDTPQVIEMFKAKYTSIKIAHNRNSENIGFFGNAKVCRDMAQGKYLWLLSDDDFVDRGVVGRIIAGIEAEEVAFVHLENQPSALCISGRKVPVGEYIRKIGFSLGLISSVIFLNEKRDDAQLFDRYSQSPFIGFILLLNACTHCEHALVLEGKCLICANSSHKLNLEFFNVWVSGMNSVTDYMNYIGIEEADILRFRRSYLTKFILVYYLRSKGASNRSSLTMCSAQFHEIDMVVRKSYRDLLSFWLLFYPTTLLPPATVRWCLSKYKIVRGRA